MYSQIVGDKQTEGQIWSPGKAFHTSYETPEQEQYRGKLQCCIFSHLCFSKKEKDNS